MSTPVRSRRSIPSILLRWGLPFLLALLLPAIAHAQEEGQQVDTAKHPITQTFSLEYDLVFRAVKTALEKKGYIIGNASKKNRRIETEFRPLAEEDAFYETMEKYGEIPYMRSPGWTIGRCQVFVTFKVDDGGHTSATVLAELSGYEARFENRWVYWGSNGDLEKEAMDAITAAVADESKSSHSGE